MANTSELKIPTKWPEPLPLLSVAMSPWYQETPKGRSGFWMTKTVNSVFLAALLRVTYRFWLPWPASVTLTLADAPLRQLLPASAADWERTILNCLRAGLAGGFDVWAMATPASSTPTSRAAPKMSHGRVRYLLLICSRSFPRPIIFLVVSFSLSRSSLDRGRS